MYGFNKNSGYCGWSMSNRAVEAYENGEMPKSKWTKKVMIEVMQEYCEDWGLLWDVSVEKMKKDELFDTFFMNTSWHHTGKYCNKTLFYGLNEAAMDRVFIEKEEKENEK